MAQTASVKVSKRYQIAVPTQVRRQLDIQSGDRLLVDIQDGMVILVPEPKDYARALEGLHKEIWEGIDARTYVAKEREAWQTGSPDSTATR